MKTFLPFLLILFYFTVHSQTTVTGSVVDNNGLPILGANIIASGTAQGTVSDFDGNFTLTVTQAPPFNIEISNIGYESRTFQVTTNNQVITAVLVEGSTNNEIVIEGSRDA